MQPGCDLTPCFVPEGVKALCHNPIQIQECGLGSECFADGASSRQEQLGQR